MDIRWKNSKNNIKNICVAKKQEKDRYVDKNEKLAHNGLSPRKVYDRKDEDYVSEN